MMQTSAEIWKKRSLIMEENKKDLINEEEKLNKVAGGESFGKKCPRCGSEDVSLYYEHDEIGVFKCSKCGHQWQESWG